MARPPSYHLINRGAAAFATGEANAAVLAFAGTQSVWPNAHVDRRGPNTGVTSFLDVTPVSFPVLYPCDDLEYRSVFSIRRAKGRGRNESWSDTVLCAAVANYNLAVSLQVLGRQKKDSLLLYQESLRILNTLTWNGGFKAVASLTVASLHNMAVILLDNQESHKAARLVTLAERVLSSWSMETQLPLLDDETHQLFSLLQYFVQPVFAAPAA